MKYYNQNSCRSSGLSCCLAMTVSALTDSVPRPELLTDDLTEFGINSAVTTDIAQAISCIEQGAIVVANVKGSLLFHGSTHVCVLKINNGRLVVLDPNLYQGKFDGEKNKIKLIGCYAYIMPTDLALEAGEYKLYSTTQLPVLFSEPAEQPVEEPNVEPADETSEQESAGYEEIPFPRSFRVPEAYKVSKAYRSPVPTQATTPAVPGHHTPPPSDKVEAEQVQEPPRYNFRSFRVADAYQPETVEAETEPSPEPHSVFEPQESPELVYDSDSESDSETVFDPEPYEQPDMQADIQHEQEEPQFEVTQEPSDSATPEPPVDNTKAEIIEWAKSVGLAGDIDPDKPITHADLWKALKQLL